MENDHGFKVGQSVLITVFMGHLYHGHVELPKGNGFFWPEFKSGTWKICPSSSMPVQTSGIWIPKNGWLQ